MGFLGGAQIDRFANLNTTVVGPYDKPRTRLPGGGGAPEISIACGEIFIVMRQTLRSFVSRLDFVTSFGHGSGGDARERLGIKTKGTTKLFTDFAIYEPDPRRSREMTVVSIYRRGHPRSRSRPIPAGRCAMRRTRSRRRLPPRRSLPVLRELHARTARAHGQAGREQDCPDQERTEQMTDLRDVFVCDAVRTPIGRLWRRARRGYAPTTWRRSRSGSSSSAIQGSTGHAWTEIVLGCANQAGEDNRNVARMALLLAGLPHRFPASPSTGCAPPA